MGASATVPDMGTGRRHGRPDDAAAPAAAEAARDIAGAAAAIVEAVHGRDLAAFTAALGQWCETVFAPAGWGVWIWRASAFELAGQGGAPPPPAEVLDGTRRSLATEATRTKLSTGRASLLVVAATGPDAAGGAVAFGDPIHLLAVLTVFRSGPRPVLGAADLAALTETGRLCSSALAGAKSSATAPAPAPILGAGLASTLLADARGPLEAIIGSARLLMDSEHNLGRMDRRRRHEVIELQALALAATLDGIAAVGAVPASGSPEAPLGPVDADAFVAELDIRLARGLGATVASDLAAALPAVGDARALAIAVAGLAAAVVATGSGHVEVAAAVGEGVGRIGVTSAIEEQAATALAATVAMVAAGDVTPAWSGRVPLAIATAGVVAHAHGGSIGADASGGRISIWLDLPTAPF